MLREPSRKISQAALNKAANYKVEKPPPTENPPRFESSKEPQFFHNDDDWNLAAAPTHNKTRHDNELHGDGHNHREPLRQSYDADDAPYDSRSGARGGTIATQRSQP